MAEKEVQKRKMPMSVKLALFFLMVVAAIFHSTTVIFIACMAPTFVAAIIDREPQKTMWITVGSLNLAGTMPAWFALWTGGNNLDVALGILTQPMMLFMAYGGAAAGWLIYFQLTPMVAALMVRKNQKRLKEIDKRQKDLVKKWGEEVTQPG